MRKFIRLPMPQGSEAWLQIVKIHGSKVSSKWAKVTVVDAGPGGAAFRTPLRFPITPGIQYWVRQTIGEEQFEWLCELIWREEGVDGYRYGASFIGTGIETSLTTKRLVPAASTYVYKKAIDSYRLYHFSSASQPRRSSAFCLLK